MKLEEHQGDEIRAVATSARDEPTCYDSVAREFESVWSPSIREIQNARNGPDGGASGRGREGRMRTGCTFQLERSCSQDASCLFDPHE